MRTQLEVAHALRKTAEWERDPEFEFERCVNSGARTVDGWSCLPLNHRAVQWCATGYLSRLIGVDLGAVGGVESVPALEGFAGELVEIEMLHDHRQYEAAADLLDGLALLVEETIPVTVHG